MCACPGIRENVVIRVVKGRIQYHSLRITLSESQMSDYERVRQVIEYFQAHTQEQPSLKAVADHLGLGEDHLRRVFVRWAGVTPKRFLQALTVAHARQRLAQPLPLLAVADAVGLSSGSRLYDHFVQLEAMTPGEVRAGGAGLAISYGVHDTPFGRVLIARTPRGICRLEFLPPMPVSQESAAAEALLQQCWPNARLSEAPQATLPIADQLCQGGEASSPLLLHVSGTNFQIQVWRALLRIPAGGVTTYARLAAASGRPTAARAVGQAVGANPVALLIPCHRVIRQSGVLGGYRWGVSRKQVLLGCEWVHKDDETDGPSV